MGIMFLLKMVLLEVVIISESLLVGEVGGTDACPQAEIVPYTIGEAQGNTVHDESVTYRVIVLVDLFGCPILRVSHLPIFIHSK